MNFYGKSIKFDGNLKFRQSFRQICKLLCTHLSKILNSYNMLLVAKYAPRKNLEKTHMRQNSAKERPNFVRKWSNLVNPGL